MSSAVTIMAKKQRGRPKAGGRINSRLSLVASAEYLAWMDEYRKFTGKQGVSDVLRDCVRRCAIEDGFRVPPIL